MMIGYARVSTPDQVLDHQIDALTRAGVAREDIHCDIASGAKASRPQLDLVLKLLRTGDTLVITRLDRLGRSLLHLVTLGAQLREREIGFLVLEQGIDTSTSEGRAMLGMLAVLAELQRDLIVANTRDGLASARARGRKGGRRPSLSRDQAELAQKLYDAGEHTVQQIADIVRVKRSTLYGHLTAGRTHASTTADAATPLAPAPTPAPALVPDPTTAPVTKKARPARRTTAVPSQSDQAARRVNLTKELGYPGTWHLTESSADSGTWHLHHNGAQVGTIRRAFTRNGRQRGWHAQLSGGTEIPATGNLATSNSSGTWRSRDLAAAGIAYHLTQQP